MCDTTNEAARRLPFLTAHASLKASAVTRPLAMLVTTWPCEFCENEALARQPE